ncbi:ubiquinol-cytochrome-c reductase complex assembly factor 1 [Micractinium conductrix]|uniref:Ubiquinol-cytochrome-c reductase complex assembly factor 1 n=1 Tax=Micractinium conductrix TaxID=554055 RepID=A0A2P6VEJ2_9CHLO|nr:ubiquinol-cytochrome-c reductase complex assembly factor 1 [Micractinium conductrix]|eukprot:PSC72498.1 ubiquinol-cytochrome-c reductase complex assembly factor 1 [Micractinium conductrix]
MLRGLTRSLGAWGALAEARLGSSGSSSAATTWAPAWAAMQRAGFASEAGEEFKRAVRNAPPRSLAFQRQPAEELAAEVERGFAVKALLTLGGYYSRESRHMRAAQRLYVAVVEQAVASPFLHAMGIPAEFQQQHSSLCLHIWLLLVRLRGEGKDGKQLAQLLYDDFQTDVEDRARKAGVRVRLQTTLTELEKQFYGSSMAYDKAVAGGEPLDKALLRNVYLLDESKAADARLLEAYVRREMACLAQTPSEAVMAGNVKFSAEGLPPADAATAAAAGGGAATDGSGAAAAPAADGAA